LLVVWETLSKPSLFHHHSQNDYSKKRSIALLSLIQKELEQKSCCIKISKLQSFTFFFSDRWNADAAQPEGRKRTSFLVVEDWKEGNGP